LAEVDWSTRTQTLGNRARIGRRLNAVTLDPNENMNTAKTTPEQNKALVPEAFDTLFNKRDYHGARPLLVGRLHSA
jgi:hypothetical protein